MSPSGKKQDSSRTPKATKALDKAVRKTEKKEAKAGKKDDPTPSVGRRIREGWIEGA